MADARRSQTTRYGVTIRCSQSTGHGIRLWYTGTLVHRDLGTPGPWYTGTLVHRDLGTPDLRTPDLGTPTACTQTTRYGVTIWCSQSTNFQQVRHAGPKYVGNIANEHFQQLG
jgi:hypothetical protein